MPSSLLWSVCHLSSPRTISCGLGVDLGECPPQFGSPDRNLGHRMRPCATVVPVGHTSCPTCRMCAPSPGCGSKITLAWHVLCLWHVPTGGSFSGTMSLKNDTCAQNRASQNSPTATRCYPRSGCTDPTSTSAPGPGWHELLAQLPGRPPTTRQTRNYQADPQLPG